ncbi:MAG: hypothetical protein D6748_11160 [Calditrichaeota bacterium]|nr:MAG: hypothetical protein D6748_11160 [Calditrichota bacterium]
MTSFKNLSILSLMFSVTLTFVLCTGNLLGQDIQSSPDGRSLTLSQETVSGGSSGNAFHIFLSLLLPGSGEWLMGNKTMGKIFLGSDALLWLSYWGSKSYVNILQNDLQGFAAVHAGVHTGNKNDQYWIDIGTAGSIYEFNSERLLDRDIDGMYPETGDYSWQWDSEENRRAYLDKRLHRLDWKRRTTYLVGGLVLNRLISAIDVIRLLRKKKPTEPTSRTSFLHIQYSPNKYQGEKVLLHLSWRF